MLYFLPFMISTFFGVGKLRPAAGTWGSAAALPFAWAIAELGGPILLLAFAAGISLIAMWAIRLFLVRWPGDDPREVVIDEVAGQWLTLAFVPTELWHYLVGFLIFRFFDVTKIWPASWADSHLDGAKGILFDDLFAGLYGMLVMIAVSYFW